MDLGRTRASFTTATPVLGGGVLTNNILRVGVNYKFGGPWSRSTEINKVRTSTKARPSRRALTFPSNSVRICAAAGGRLLRPALADALLFAHTALGRSVE